MDDDHATDDPTRHACVVGAGGGLGHALAEALASRDAFASVTAISRQPAPAGTAAAVQWLQADMASADERARAVDELRGRSGRLHLLICCIGVLHGEGFEPEKSLRALDAEAFQQVMSINALLPLQVLYAMAPLLRHGERPVAATLSAMVGSIEDNRLGGWYSYRMSKAALNMGLRCAAVELGRGGRGPAIVAIHPGTTETALSEPFLGRHPARSAAESAPYIIDVLEGLDPDTRSAFLNWDGKPIPY